MARILIVDDNVALAENLAEVLQDHGHATSVFSDPRAVQAQFQPGQFSLVLMDLRMPHVDGVTLFQQLRERDPALACVVMTAWAKDENVLDAMEAGVHAVMSKPVAPLELVALLHTVLEGPAALVVDDDRSFAANMVEVLQHHGVSARAATSCAMARSALRHGLPQLLLVDFRLPDGDGATLLRELSDRAPACRCILMSAWDMPADASATSHGAIQRMPKPVALDSVLDGLPPPRAHA